MTRRKQKRRKVCEGRKGTTVRDFPLKRENKKVLKVNKHFKHAAFNKVLVMFLYLYIDVFSVKAVLFFAAIIKPSG